MQVWWPWLFSPTCTSYIRPLDNSLCTEMFSPNITHLRLPTFPENENRHFDTSVPLPVQPPSARIVSILDASSSGNFDTSLGTEELAHMEMVSTIVHQLTRDLTPEQIKNSGFATYFVDHTTGIWPQAASGAPWSSDYFQSKGDAITDIHEDMAAEQKARTTYDNILRLIDNPEVIDPIRFLREREIVHYQRFGEALDLVTDRLNEKNFYAFNPEYDLRPQR